MIYHSHWKLDASKNDVMESIRQFFHLCLNAKLVENKLYDKIPRWTKELLFAACMPQDSKIIDADRYSNLVQASDPFTKFIFASFDWRITDKDPRSIYNDSYLDTYDSRIGYYKNCAAHWPLDEKDGEKYRFSANLLYDIKDTRNQESHNSKEEFFAEHPKCMQRLIYILYDFIAIFHMISHVCKDHNGKKVSLREDVRKKTKMPHNFCSTHIVIECVDESNGSNLPDREKDVRLYQLNNSNMKAVNAIANCPGKYEVNYFDKYEIRIVTDGIESLPSETFVIEHDFTDGTIVKINIPPQGKSPKPEKISIRELIFGTEDLPADINWILDTVEQNARNSELATVARNLVMASVTKTEFSKNAYKKALEQLRVSLENQIKAEHPRNFNDFMKEEMHRFQENFSESFKPYRGKEDFFKLLECIDDLYDAFGSSGYDHNTTHISQIISNADNILNEVRITNATAASDESTRQQQRLQKLKFLFSMQDKYPEIVETESSHLRERIEELYINQINYYMDYTSPLIVSIRELHSYIKNNADHLTHGQEKERYAELLDNFLNDTPDNVIRIVHLISTTLLYWLDRCCSSEENDETIIALKQQCCDNIKHIRDNQELQVPMIPLGEEDRKKTEHVYSIIRRCIDELKVRQGVLGLPVTDSELLSSVRFESLSQLVSDCSPYSFMQLVCNSLNAKIQIEWLLTCSSLGISCNGIDVSIPYFEWKQSNEAILHGCTKVVAILRRHFAGRERSRVGDSYYSTENEVSNAEASLIVDYQKQRISKLFGDSIPEYYLAIVKVSDFQLPCHAKAFLLREATVKHSCDTERLLYVIKAALHYQRYSSLLGRRFLDSYITGEFAKKLVSQKAQEEFALMQNKSKRIYLDILMDEKNHFAGLMPYTRYMMACRLNFAKGENGNDVIEQREFFLNLSLLSSYEISPYSYTEFVDLSNVVSLVAQYSNKHPEDEEMSALSAAQTRKFIAACLDYLDKHLNIRPIEDGTRQSSLLRKYYLKQELKGKSPFEQSIVRYLDLYDGFDYHLDDSGRYKSEWCEMEKKLFYEIISTLKEKSAIEQQDICRHLWKTIYWGNWGCWMPYDDFKAERLMALQPFMDQKEFEEKLNSFYRDSCYGKGVITIGNPSVLDGLNEIRTLFNQYGKNVKVLFDEQPTAFVDVQIAIYKLLLMRPNS